MPARLPFVRFSAVLLPKARRSQRRLACGRMRTIPAARLGQTTPCEEIGAAHWDPAYLVVDFHVLPSAVSSAVSVRDFKGRGSLSVCGC